MMITRLVGKFGIGNRPGRSDFGYGYGWPYGKRDATLPVWAHRRGVEYDRLVFQDCVEESLGWHEDRSSHEPFFCRPTTPLENDGPIDTITCPSRNFSTDKGIPQRLIDRRFPACDALAGQVEKTFYPPRADLRVLGPNDWDGVEDYHKLNGLDAVTYATPKSEAPFRVTYALPGPLADGNYVVWIEVNRERDTNQYYQFDFYQDTRLPGYGMQELGQPSIVWRVPIAVADHSTVATALDYAGYGAPHGEDGALRPPDSTITNDPSAQRNNRGSGADRLLITAGGEAPYRVKVSYNSAANCPIPAAVSSLAFVKSDWSSVTLSFPVSSDAAYYRAAYLEGRNAIKNDDDFLNAIPGPRIDPGAPGSTQSFTVDGLRDRALYTFAIRAYNHCGAPSGITTFESTTPVRIFTTVGWCFIATAAYGSEDEAHVVELQKFRDRVLMKTDAGRAFVDFYYSVSPPFAEGIRDHEVLRWIVRRMMDPVVAAARDFE
jgi:hypothetical protein